MGSDTRALVGGRWGAKRPPSAEEKAAELQELRRKIAAVPGRGAGKIVRVPLDARASDAAASSAGSVLPVPPALADLLPDRGLPKGAVVTYRGANSLLAGLLAAVTADGGHAAVIGMPRLGLLAAAEMGAQLSRLAVIADPGPDPVEVASVLLDGLDLVVLGLRGAAVPPARTKVLAARARGKGATLMVADGRWSAAALDLTARVEGYAGLGYGRGRLRSFCLEVEVRGKAGHTRRDRLELRPRAGRSEWVRVESSSAARVVAAVS